MRPNRLLILPLIFSSLIFQGLSCDDPPTEPLCDVTTSGPTQLRVGDTGTYELYWGGCYVLETSPTISVDGSAVQGAITTTATQVSSDITFPEVGTYTVTLSVVSLDTDSEVLISRTIVVEVTAPVLDCDATLLGPLALEVGTRGDFRVELGNSWGTTGTPASYEITWEVVFGPGGGATPAGRTQEALRANASFDFSIAGTYTIRATVTDQRTGAETCPSFSDEIDVVVTAPPTGSIPTGAIALGTSAPDGLSVAMGQSAASRLGAEAVVAVAVATGVDAIDLATQQVVSGAQDIFATPPSSPLLGAQFLGGDSPAEPLALAEFGGNGLTILQWDDANNQWFDFAQLVEFQSSVFDFNPIGPSATTAHYVTGRDQVEEFTYNPATPGFENAVVLSGGQLPGPHGSLISAAGAAAGGGPLLVVTGGRPGALFLWHDAGSGFMGTNLGSVGNDPRRLRYANGIGVCTNFGSDSISICTWDEGGNATLVGNQAVGDGPVGCDLRARPGGGVFALTTGFNDGSYTITEIDGAGAVVGNTTTTIPGGLMQPAHGAWIGDADDSFVISAFGSDALYVGR